MNTISLGKLRLQTGVRIESTQDTLLANKLDLTTDPISVTPLRQNNSLHQCVPQRAGSVSVGYRYHPARIYGMGIARPNFGDIAPYFIDDPSSVPEFSKGIPDLKPTHAQNFDVLLEHYLKQVGLIQGGFFYKALTDPIYPVTINQGTPDATAPWTNGPSAHILGFEAAWQQRLSFLPRGLNGIGVRANYSYTTSQATFPAGTGPTIPPRAHGTEQLEF